MKHLFFIAILALTSCKKAPQPDHYSYNLSGTGNFYISYRNATNDTTKVSIQNNWSYDWEQTSTRQLYLRATALTNSSFTISIAKNGSIIKENTATGLNSVTTLTTYE